MKDVLAAVRLLLSDLSKLSVPAVATAIAGTVVPIVAAVAGLNITAAELAGWLVLAGGIAATLEKLTTVKAAKAKAARRSSRAK